MRIRDVIEQVLPDGTDAAFIQTGTPSYLLCPIWPPDLFAVVGTVIDRSGCYTESSPDRNGLREHELYLSRIEKTAKAWTNLLHVPKRLRDLWLLLIKKYGEVELDEIVINPKALKTLLTLFAIADEASVGMGWKQSSSLKVPSDFVTNVLANSDPEGMPIAFPMPYWPQSLCGMVSPDRVIVLPKSITTTKGCTIRSLSHNLALLPCETTLRPEWRLVSRIDERRQSDDLRLLLVPYPYSIPDGSFKLTSKRSSLNNHTTHAAFFGLEQRWLNEDNGEPIHGSVLAERLILPLIEEARLESGRAPDGIVLPECSLSANTTEEMVRALQGSGIEFVITGALEKDEVTGRVLNTAYTIVMLAEDILARAQSKHHRWRIDQRQADSYGLDFDPDKTNHQWWEDIDVTMRDLPFYAVREDMSLVTLICEDLARMDPAMNAIRAVGPNLVVALLMDGPQLPTRWPGRYAGVLADEPGCTVLSLTCAATVDLSNHYYMSQVEDAKVPERVVALLTQPDFPAVQVVLPDHANGILLTLSSSSKHQTTLDNRSDNSLSQQLSFKAQKPLFSGLRS